MGLLDLIANTYHDIGQQKLDAGLRSGQIWGNALASLGQIPGQIQEQKVRDQQIQTSQLQNQVTQAQLTGLKAEQASQAAAQQVLSDPAVMNPDHTYNLPVLSQKLGAAGISPTVQANLLDTFGKLNTSFAKQHEDQLNADGDLANGALEGHDAANPLTKEEAQWYLASAVTQGRATQAHIDPLLQELANGTDPTQIFKTVKSFAPKYGGPAKFTAIGPNGVLNESTQQVIGGEQKPKTVAEQEMDAQTLGTPNETPTARYSSAAVAARDQAKATATTKSVLLDGKPAEVRVNQKGQFIDDSGAVIPSSRVTPLPPPSAVNVLGPNAGQSDTVQGYIQDLLTGTKKLADVPAAQGTRNAVVAELHKEGYDISKPLTAQTQARVEFANGVMPQVQQVADLAKKINDAGLMGTVGGRFRALASGESSAADLQGLTPEQRKLVGEFTTKAGLLLSGVAMVHGGARGGGSTQLLEQLKPMLDPHNKDIDTYLGNLSAARDILQGYADMGGKAKGGKTEAPADYVFDPKTGKLTKVGGGG